MAAVFADETALESQSESDPNDRALALVSPPPPQSTPRERGLGTDQPATSPPARTTRSDLQPPDSNTVPGEPRTDARFQDLQQVQTNRTTHSGKPYSVFSDGQKWFIVIFSALGAIFSPISTNIYVPAIPTLARAFGVTTEKINLTVTVYLVFQALTPAIWGSAGDCFGRRPIYILCLTIYLLSCVGTALCPTSAYWLLMLMRVLQATGGSALIAIGTGVVSDIAMPHERGRYIGLFNLGTTVGPALGPLLGGVFAYTLGWRSIFWFLVIFCACVVIPMILAFPETLRSLVGDGSLPPPLLNCTPAALLRRKRELREAAQDGETPEDLGHHRAKFKPWASFLLFLQPDIALMFTWSSLYYANWYALLTVFSTLLHTQYGTNEVVIGLCYIPNGVGAGLSGFLTGRIMDVFYRREKRRVGGDHRQYPETFRLERVRFMILPYHIGILLAATLGLAWSIEVHAHIAVPIVLNFFVGIGVGFLTTTTIYGIDLFAGQGGAVTATFNLIRCALGAVTVSTVDLIVQRMGAGWCFVLLSGICLVGTPMPLICLKYGPKWRVRRIERAKQKVEQNQPGAVIGSAAETKALG
ncbi:hypothetical protein IAU60_000901 [Kwoniella sp. DSM 27419]